MSAPRPRAVTPALLRGWALPQADAQGGKNERGRLVIVGGSAEIPGALRLAGEAGLRAGAGTLVLATARSARESLGSVVPEARVIGVAADRSGQPVPDATVDRAAHEADALLVGPGMRDTPALRRWLGRLVARVPGPLVLDAGALSGAACRAGGAVRLLTPHAGEMAALTGEPEQRVAANAAALAQAAARDWGALVILKGAATVISDGEATFLHRRSVPGLGTSGSGDVLAGLLAGLLARGTPPLAAACWAVWAHAAAGAELTRRHGALGLLARELPGRLPSVLNSLTRGRG